MLDRENGIYKQKALSTLQNTDYQMKEYNAAHESRLDPCVNDVVLDAIVDCYLNLIPSFFIVHQLWCSLKVS
jgi:hypothetical protein